MFAHPSIGNPGFDLDSYQTLPAGKKQDFKCTITDFTEEPQDEGFEQALQQLSFAEGQLNLGIDWDLDGLMGDDDSYPFTDLPHAAGGNAEGLIDSFYAGIFDEDSDNWGEIADDIASPIFTNLNFALRGSQIIVDTPDGEIPSFNVDNVTNESRGCLQIPLPGLPIDPRDFNIPNR
jgi:hypothetical protein